MKNEVVSEGGLLRGFRGRCFRGGKVELIRVNLMA